MWTYERDAENSISFMKDGVVKLQMITDDSLTDDDINLAERVFAALIKCEV